MSNHNEEPKGLGGWLILVGIGIVLAPARLLVTYIPIYSPLFEGGTWEALTTIGSEFYTPYFAPLVIGEMAYNSIMFVASLYLIYLFFTKHYLFPKIYIGIIVISIIFIPFDAWLASKVFPDEPMLDPETTKELLRTLVQAAIWVPYMLISKRVKATFVENLPNKNIQPSTEMAG